MTQYRVLGRTGLRVSEVGVGGAQFGLTHYMGHWDAFSEAAERDTTATVHRALELGYTYFDTAPGYGNGRSEEMVGRALAGHAMRLSSRLRSAVDSGLPMQSISASRPACAGSALT
jgi:aryl-alcohol dehydrogenase-like predicted oxidoreductase